ncbi:MAG: chlorosome envelope protein B [Chlorobiaceae bacterium]|nr:chlorosome envelope protein B [Chlorobiaceae bacterium]
MANENNPVGAVNELVDVASKTAQQLADTLCGGIKSAAGMVDPLGKACVSFLSTVLGAATQLFEGVAGCCAPKK